MREFTDAEGAKWTLHLNGAVIVRFKSMADVAWGGYDEKGRDPITRFFVDDAFALKLLYVACKPQADGRNITEEEFYCRLDGKAFAEASKALMDELFDFFRHRRPEVASVLRRIQETMRRIAKVASSETMKAHLQQQMDELIGKAFGELSASAPQSPA